MTEMTEKEIHFLHYLGLFVGLSVVSVLFVIFRYNYWMQIGLVGLGSGYYFIWGVIHHSLERRLNRLVILEYLLFASLAFLLIFLALNI